MKLRNPYLYHRSPRVGVGRVRGVAELEVGLAHANGLGVVVQGVSSRGGSRWEPLRAIRSQQQRVFV